jgi:hypothetical protein
MVELELTLLNYTYYDRIDTNHTNNYKLSQNNLLAQPARGGQALALEPRFKASIYLSMRVEDPGILTGRVKPRRRLFIPLGFSGGS